MSTFNKPTNLPEHYIYNTYTYDDVESYVEDMYSAFWEESSREFMLICALALAAELNFGLGLSFKKINTIFKECEQAYLKSLSDEHQKEREA